VTVSSPAAAPGGYATLTFKVPTESATASTTRVKVQLPADQPLASVSILPTPGWSYVVTRAKTTPPASSSDGPPRAAVATVEWTANSAASAIKPGEFQQFVISAGPLPKAATMTFKAIQTYSDASVVSWIEQAAPGSAAAPEHPAPTLTLTASTTSTASAASSATSASSGSKATTGIVLGAVGIVLGGLALAAVLVRTRVRPSA
jgi:uncharacterized protein